MSTSTLNINEPTPVGGPKEYTAKTGFVTGELNVHVYGKIALLPLKYIELVSIGFLIAQVL